MSTPCRCGVGGRKITVKNQQIDHGRAFDWGRTSPEYAQYRDIYPPEFYRRLTENGLCIAGQKVLDVGTGTGVLPRNLYPYGASFIGIDSSQNQIDQAVSLSRTAGMAIEYRCVPAEQIDFPPGTFDVVTACQCMVYFDHAVLAPMTARGLRDGGHLVFLYMAWLPDEDPIAGQSEALILKHNPAWTGCGETRHPITVPAPYLDFFTVEREEVFDLSVPFTRESWNGRVKTCRGIGAALSEPAIGRFDAEHRKLLREIAPEQFNILHYAAITVLRKKRGILSAQNHDKSPCFREQ